MIYKIKDWNERFENNRSRAVVKTTWVPVPNKHDGEGYLALMDMKNGVRIYGCWILILQVASKCQPRGTLVRANGQPHDAGSISRIARVHVEEIEEALKVLSNPEIGWLIVSNDEVPNVAPERQAGVSSWRPSDEGMEWNGMEKKGRELHPQAGALSSFLLEAIRKNNPEFKEPNLKNWNKGFDLMLRVDKREESEIRAVIEFAQTPGGFWNANILSAGKLREKFDTLKMQMKRNTEKPKIKTPTDQVLERFAKEKLKGLR